MRTPEPSRTILLRAALLRRRLSEPLEGMSWQAGRRLERAWNALVDVADARASVHGASADILDKRIRAHVDTLERLYAAADERVARVGGLEDKPLAEAALERDEMEAAASALAEVTATERNASG
jgi:hypothetical protein